MNPTGPRRRWQTDSNMGEALVSKGLAGVIRHRQDDDNRASAYDQLLMAEDRYRRDARPACFVRQRRPLMMTLSESGPAARRTGGPRPPGTRAQKGKKGMHSGKEAAAIRLSDASEVSVRTAAQPRCP